MDDAHHYEWPTPEPHGDEPTGDGQVPGTPTQVKHPARATARSVFQALVAFAAIAPLIAVAVEEATSYDLDGVPFVVAALAACAAITRVMALPAVEGFLERFVPFLSASPKGGE